MNCSHNHLTYPKMMNLLTLVTDQPTHHFLSKVELDYLVKDLELTKEKSELLAFRLKEWNFLDSDCKVASFRKRHELLSSFDISKNDELAYTPNIPEVFAKLEIPYNPSDWRLFIDS